MKKKTVPMSLRWGNLRETGVNQDPLYLRQMVEEESSQQEGIRVEWSQSWPH